MSQLELDFSNECGKVMIPTEWRKMTSEFMKQPLVLSKRVLKSKHQDQQCTTFDSGQALKIALIAVVIILLFIFFCLDVGNEVLEEKHHQLLHKQKCNQEYSFNNCENPVDSIVQQCQQYKKCAQKPVQTSVRYTEKIMKVIGNSLKTLLFHLGTIGILFIFGIACFKSIFLNKYKY